MSDGFIYWCRESASPPDLAEQAAIFAEYGIHLVHPARVAAVVLDMDGNGVLMEPAELARLVSLRITSLTMQWWFTPDTDVTDTYSPKPCGGEIQVLWLDGLGSDEMHAVEVAVTAAATRLAPTTRALVIDRHGATDPDDWESLVLYGGTRIPPFPDSLLADNTLTAKLMAASPLLTTEPITEKLTRLTPSHPG